MRIRFLDSDVKFTESMERETAKKLAVLDKYFVIKDDTVASVTIKKYGKFKKIRVVIPTDFKTFKCEVMSDEYYETLDRAVDILERQVRHVKEKVQKKSDRDSLGEAVVSTAELPDNDNYVVKEKLIFPEKISRDKAIEEMNELGHDFFIFIDEDTDSPSVLYHRRDGDYGVLVIR